MKKKTIIISLIIFFLLAAICCAYLIIHHTENKHFSIISVSNVNKNFSIKYEKTKSTKYFKIIVYDSDNSPLFVKETSNNYLNATFDFINYKEEYLITIFAYDEKGNSIVVENPYKFIYKEPTFSKDNSLLFTNDEDYLLKIDGDLKSKNYYISVNDGSYTIKKEKLTDNKYIISKDLFTGIEEVLQVKLFDESSEIAHFDIYSNMSPVKDIKIVSPINNKLEHNDINLKFEGGENATKFIMQIYNNTTNRLIKGIQISKKEIMVSKDFFKKGENYTITIKGIYDNYAKYTKSAETKFEIDTKDVIKPPYISNIISSNNNYIELKNPNNKGDIFFTLDGSDPLEFGTKYDDKILILNKVTINAVVKDKTNSSNIISFEMDNKIKEKYNIYISSYAENNQDGMYELAKYIKEKLNKHNINVYINDKNESISSRIKKANELKLDLYLGLYSNSASKEIYGIETWIDKELNSSYSLANLIQERTINTYYDKKANHGIKYSNGLIDELNKINSNLNIRIVIGNLENENDANWFDTKYEEIGTSISDTILKYFAII